jgi:hypothetical protein
MNVFTTVMLVVTIITGEGQKNILDKREMPDMETCEAASHEFLHHKFPDYLQTKGLIASCQGKLAEENPS